MILKTCTLSWKNEGSETDRVGYSKCLEVLKSWAVSYPFYWSNLTPEMTNIALNTVIQGLLQHVCI